jgi:predicted amidohydrolase
MKIALIQQHCTKNKESNVKRGLESARIAAEKGAKIICFAELAFEPFYPQVPATDNNLKLAETIPGKTTELFSEIAKEFGVTIILNLFERDVDRTFDSSPVIGADGSLIGTTRMIHITDYPCFHEQGYYTPGDIKPQVYRTEHCNFGIAICYDRHYPEYMRTLALQGADIVFIPQAGAIGEWPEGLYEAEMQTAAFQNGYYTALCNRVGKEEKLTFAGESFICDPGGKVVARATEGEDEILCYDIDLEEIKNSHARQLFLRDRRPELYKDWL